MAKTATAVAPTIAESFAATADSMGTYVVERSDFIDALLVALVGRLNIFALGKPGTGKSYAVRTLVKHITAMPEFAYYERLLTKFSVPSELFGPLDIPALEQGVYRHVTRGTLVEAIIGFVDEIWKGNSAILNSFLAIANERIFHNDVVMNIPLAVLVGASNEVPKGEELAAIHDRMTLNVKVEPVQGSSAWVQMLKAEHRGEVVPTLSFEQVQQAQKEAAEVEVPNDVFDAMIDLRGNLARKGVQPTDRRWFDSQQAIRATAWLRGDTSCEIGDLRVLRHSLWTSPADQLTVEKEVLGLSSPLERQALELRHAVGELQDEFEKIINNSDNEKQQHDQAIDLHTKVDRATDEAIALEAQLGTGRRSQVIDDTKAALDSMNDYVLRNVFGIDPEKRAARRQAS